MSPSKRKSTALQHADLGTSAFHLIDTFVELYLSSVIKPFVALHEVFYSGLNTVLRKCLEDHKDRIPVWFTANFITYFRTALVIPTLILLAWQHQVLPALIVILVDFGDFLDGVVARYWVDVRNEQKKALESKKDKKEVSKKGTATTTGRSSPTDSDEDGFEFVTTGSPHSVPSWVVLHRNRTYGGFVDAVCDKAFVIPCWISLLHIVPSTQYFNLFQYVTFVSLVLAETASGCIRFQAFFTSGGVAAPKVETSTTPGGGGGGDLDFSTSAVKADHVGKAKQTFEMVGTALYIFNMTTRYIGLALLMLALPLAYESVRRKIKTRVLYVVATSSTNSKDLSSFDHKTLRFWMQARAMGSKLIVGVPGASGKDVTDMVLNACASSSVDEVITEAPVKVDLMFLEKQGIDYVILPATASTTMTASAASNYVTDEVMNAQCVLSIGADGVARPVLAKGASKSE